MSEWDIRPLNGALCSPARQELLLDALCDAWRGWRATRSTSAYDDFRRALRACNTLVDPADVRRRIPTSGHESSVLAKFVDRMPAQSRLQSVDPRDVVDEARVEQLLAEWRRADEERRAISL